MSFILETLIGGGIAAGVLGAIPYLSYVGYVYKFKVVNIFKYKYTKHQIYKGIEKAIAEENIQEVRDWFELLAKFDSKYDRSKTMVLKKKYGIRNEILDDAKLFKLKYDSRYLVENYLGIHTGSLEIEEKEKQLLLKEKELEHFSDYNNIKKKEYELDIKEEELKNKEKEIQEIISNLNML